MDFWRFMDDFCNLISPKQLARAIGVSESSLKRWCDRGLIETVRTAGGHRKMSIAAVLAFIRENDYQLVSPEVLGLPPVSDGAQLGISRGRARLVESLLAGDELVARQIVFDLYMARHSVSMICDEVIAGAFHEIGERWACLDADVFQERRGCEIALRILYELRQVLPQTGRSCLAMGGTIECDYYTLPTSMAEVVLRDAGYRAVSLGTSIPFCSLARCVEDQKPNLFWLSVSHIRDGLDFVSEFDELSRACSSAGTALVVGGRAIDEKIRQKITYSAFCDTMQHLEACGKTFLCNTSANDITGTAKS